jgi:hypothetical protein
MKFVQLGSAIALAAACVAGSSAPAGADEGVMHQVTYSVFAEQPFRAADIYYRDTEPPNWSDYSHDPYVFSPSAEATVGPGRPWVLEATLTDPIQWGMVSVQAQGALPKATAGFNCTMAINGIVVKQSSGPKGALCSLRNW